MNDKDLALVKEFMNDKNLDLLNTRAFKSNDSMKFIISVGSIDKNEKEYKFKDAVFLVQYGEFSSYLSEVNFNLAKAIKFSANDNQVSMLLEYIKSFESGSINDHKNSQRAWIKDKSPVVESNIGWIEHYVDPQNMRAIWEGWVAIVDKKRSETFHNLVGMSDKIVP